MPSLLFVGFDLKSIDPSRIRTCNLLIRSQTRYPLRHGTKCWTQGLGSLQTVPFTKVWESGRRRPAKFSNGFLSVVVITCPSHGQGRRFDPGREQGESFAVSILFKGPQATFESVKVKSNKYPPY